MGTKVTSSSGSVLKEPEIQKLQMQAKIFKENSLNKLNALKTTIQHLSSSNHSMYLRVLEKLCQRTLMQMKDFKVCAISKLMNLEMAISNENIRADFNSELSCYNGNSMHTLPWSSNPSGNLHPDMNSIVPMYNSNEIVMQQELDDMKRDETAVGLYQMKRLKKKEIGRHITVSMAKIQERHSEQPESINDTYVLEKDDSNVTPDSSNICNNDNQVDQNAAECVDERAALANLIANLKLDVDENKKIQKQLKKANATLTQELTECKSILAETSRTLGESNSIRDSCLVALQNKQTEFERYKAFNDRTVDYDKLEHKLNEALGLIAQKEIDIKEV
ncbi:hypothetical protein Tco_0937477 [Tanacetum coccineum]|uniref:Uncharacterized protein n=1 Tax=Tanacetum coccineum TaxID=301880 RepID=A0ABQ5DFG1_9ASTR